MYSYIHGGAQDNRRFAIRFFLKVVRTQGEELAEKALATLLTHTQAFCRDKHKTEEYLRNGWYDESVPSWEKAELVNELAGAPFFMSVY